MCTTMSMSTPKTSSGSSVTITLDELAHAIHIGGNNINMAEMPTVSAELFVDAIHRAKSMSTPKTSSDSSVTVTLDELARAIVNNNNIINIAEMPTVSVELFNDALSRLEHQPPAGQAQRKSNSRCLCANI